MLDLLKIIVAFSLVMIGAFVAQCWPEILTGLFQARRDREEREKFQQAEIARKTAIADAAIAARARGEKFIPPADYDR